MGLFDKLKGKLQKTKQGFVDKVTELVTGYKRVDDEFFERLEEILIEADVGVNTAMDLTEKLRHRIYTEKISDMDRVNEVIQEELAGLLEYENNAINLAEHKPTVIMVVGVNGVGKTTTIGKLAYNFKEQGKKVVLAAGDTFRAAAIEQLGIWADRADADLIKHQEGSDAAAVAYDAVQAAISRKADIVLIDTAGRLHNKVNLMNEIGKVKKVISRSKEDAPNEVLLVLDATTGQNAISQAKTFKEVVDVTGIVLTKLDGTAKGGVIFSIKEELALPVKYIGVGEKIEDLKPFNPGEFVKALFYNEQ
ncbi:signal recognition particle-docking protein FtsY [Desulfitibacter alkalitolerans]|uniref:signal recognition particle-docking protein FtsY n=1 Tax=Desulfitibacter alkalitolerans TaxID=264641 RepID=UPI00047FD58C|nr:signal recognition particle-docking protein FtsY [Desulfitibacter alkalitolerans]